MVAVTIPSQWYLFIVLTFFKKRGESSAKALFTLLTGLTFPFYSKLQGKLKKTTCVLQFLFMIDYWLVKNRKVRDRMRKFKVSPGANSVNAISPLLWRKHTPTLERCRLCLSRSPWASVRYRCVFSVLTQWHIPCVRKQQANEDGGHMMEFGGGVPVGSVGHLCKAASDIYVMLRISFLSLFYIE